jgi:hypothetical protein
MNPKRFQEMHHAMSLVDAAEKAKEQDRRRQIKKKKLKAAKREA